MHGIETQKILKGSSAKLMANPFTDPEGQTFLGWNTVSEPTDENPGISYANQATITIPASVPSLDLYAQWGYKVTWNPNGGTLKDASQKEMYFKAGADIEQSQIPQVTRGSCIFQGWYTEKEGGGKIENVAGAMRIQSNKTFYAHWKGAEDDITLNTQSVVGRSVKWSQGQKIATWYKGNYQLLFAPVLVEHIGNEQTDRIAIVLKAVNAAKTSEYKYIALPPTDISPGKVVHSGTGQEVDVYWGGPVPLTQMVRETTFSGVKTVMVTGLNAGVNFDRPAKYVMPEVKFRFQVNKVTIPYAKANMWLYIYTMTDNCKGAYFCHSESGNLHWKYLI